MIRKLRAAWRIVRCKGYILCTIKDNPLQPFYDHNVCEEDILVYNKFISDIYTGSQDALRQAKEILDADI